MKDYVTVPEDLIKITKYEVLDKLPNPFVFNDGTLVKTKEDWEKRRKEIFDCTVELQYGKMPPEPEFLEVTPAYNSPNGLSSYNIKTGTKEKPVFLSMHIAMPKGEGPFPTAITGDLCFDAVYDREWINAFRDKGIMLVMFDRTNLAPDVAEHFRKGQIFETYPDYDGKAIAVWAWGYSRCLDAVEKLGLADMNCITFTGLSRGGKTAMLAGVMDERATIVNPNATCAGGCSCYRLNISAITEDNEEKSSETITITERFPHWFNPELKKYIDREPELPFDSHYLKALIAPRVYVQTEAGSDIWANPVGAWQTTMAVSEVYKFLDAENNIFWHYRNGYHDQTVRDVDMLVNAILHVYKGEKLDETFFHTPFKKPELMFDWRCPEK